MKIEQRDYDEELTSLIKLIEDSGISVPRPEETLLLIEEFFIPRPRWVSTQTSDMEVKDAST